MVAVMFCSCFRRLDTNAFVRSSAILACACMKRRPLRICVARRSVGVGVGGDEVSGERERSSFRD